MRNASLHNLKHITVDFPLGRLVAVTGVSGSGKSTLVRDVLRSSLQAKLESPAAKLRGCEAIEWNKDTPLGRVLEVDQTPIGKTPRSCPATYVSFFNQIRDLYAQTPEAQARGYQPTRFSFNTPEGRCPVCEGQGQVSVEMSFLPNVKMPCEACSGMRFDEETLAVKWMGKSIGDVLNLSVDDALELFANRPKIAKPLELLQAVGLGYLRLGQPSSTLSGGEAQRIKLVTELSKAYSQMRTRRTAHTFYILDEPTVGLHMADVEKLINVLHKLVEAGNTVVVIEHNLDVINCADWVIDLGPEGGDAGGEIVVQGTLEALIAEPRSYTGQALRTYRKTLEQKNTSAYFIDEAAKTADQAPVAAPNDVIAIKGAKEHNLKNISVDIPHWESIKRVVDSVFLLHRDGYYTGDTSQYQVATIAAGPSIDRCAVLSLLWDKMTGRFLPYDARLL